jgi:hypothetical protein
MGTLFNNLIDIEFSWRWIFSGEVMGDVVTL